MLLESPVSPTSALSRGRRRSSLSVLSPGSGFSSVSTNQEQQFSAWCSVRLQRSLQELRNVTWASNFLMPFPWKELGLNDYPEVVCDPLDLSTIGTRLEY